MKVIDFLLEHSTVSQHELISIMMVEEKVIHLLIINRELVEV